MTLRRSGIGTGSINTPDIVREVLAKPGAPLDSDTRGIFQSRFGHDFSQVRIHTGSRAAEAALAVGARAFTVGGDVVFGAQQYAPRTTAGMALLAHELTHTVQQKFLRGPETANPRLDDPNGQGEREAKGVEDSLRIYLASGTSAIDARPSVRKVPVLQRKPDDEPSSMDRTPPPAIAVPGGSECDDPDFCTPFTTVGEAVRTRNRMINVFVPLETAKFGAEVGALWLRYLSRKPGDSLAPTVFDSPSSSIVQGFASSATTAERQEELIKEIKKALPGFCLFVPIGTWTTLPIESLLPATSLDYPIDFDQPFEIPGNIAGGVGGSDAGPDWRHVSGTISLTRTVDRSGAVVGARVRTTLRFVVFDAVDFCPGQCGAPAEQLLTVPLSQLEASGFAYDVPFLVRYEGPQVEAEIDVTLVPPCSLGPQPAQDTAAASSRGHTLEPA